jgi:hypothetical protein
MGILLVPNHGSASNTAKYETHGLFNRSLYQPLRSSTTYCLMIWGIIQFLVAAYARQRIRLALLICGFMVPQ